MGTQQAATGDECCTVNGYMRCCMHDMGLECCLLCSSEGPYTQRPAGIALLTPPFDNSDAACFLMQMWAGYLR